MDIVLQARVVVVQKAQIARIFSLFVLLFSAVYSISDSRAAGSDDVPDTSGPSYIDVPWLTAPVLYKGVVRSYVIFEIKLQVASNSDAEEVMVQMPRLRDAFLRALHRSSIVRNDGSGALDFDSISQRLKKSANKVLGEEKINQVLIVKAIRSAA